MTENTITTWRDLEGLTDEQVASMEDYERIILGHHPEDQDILIKQAEHMRDCNRIDATYANVPVPAGATTDTAGWTLDTETGGWSRSVEWAQFPTSVRAVDIYIDGRQQTDGSYTSQVSLYSDGAHLTADEAIAVARALLEAAGTLNRMTGVEPPFM